VPAVQSVQTGAPSTEYLPAAQGVHVAAACSEDFPAAQGVHTESVVAPVVAEDFPAVHSAQTEAVSSEYLPATQLAHVLVAEYLPAVQLVQALDAATEYLPVLHFVHSRLPGTIQVAVKPSSVPVPYASNVTLRKPVADEYFPSGIVSPECSRISIEFMQSKSRGTSLHV